MHKIPTIAAVAMLSACAVKPEVSYKLIKAANNSMDINLTDSFYLAASIITIQATTEKVIDASGQQEDKTTFTVNNETIDETSFKLGLIAKESLWKKTRVNIVKEDNSDRVKEIGIETTDNRVQAIKDISSVFVTALSVAALAGTGHKTPIKKTVSPLFFNIFLDSKHLSKTGFEITRNWKFGDYTVDVQFSPKPIDAISKEEWQKEETLAKFKNSFIYSACRDVTITIKNTVTNNTQFLRTRVPDPDNIQFVALPVKGKVVTHTQCGVSVTTEASSSSSDAAVVAALLTEVKNIKTEINKGK